MYECMYVCMYVCIYVCKYVCMYVVTSLAGVLYVIYLCWVTGIGFDIVVTLLLSKVWSFAEWFFIMTPYYAYVYPVDKKHFYSKLRKKTLKQLSTRDNTNVSGNVSNRDEKVNEDSDSDVSEDEFILESDIIQRV